ncbi:unnamed protein product [Pieris macdunnoughi]|uniref:Uncharacterized protein n=1 Tax=Pieris macdunnoughi TaxID=345717 RepID=A0A821T142_9NEOP|nr:unnamed protein product [Pieris macdunnoughi]
MDNCNVGSRCVADLSEDKELVRSRKCLKSAVSCVDARRRDVEDRILHSASTSHDEFRPMRSDQFFRSQSMYVFLTYEVAEVDNTTY